MLLPRAECWAKSASAGDWAVNAYILQAGLGGCPWRVAVASMLLNKTRRVQAQPVLCELFARWPSASLLATADGAEVEAVVRPCGLHRSRARRLQRFSVQYTGAFWSDLTELVGVGPYVADAVAIVCFEARTVVSNDPALQRYLEHLREAEAAVPSPVVDSASQAG